MKTNLRIIKIKYEIYENQAIEYQVIIAFIVSLYYNVLPHLSSTDLRGCCCCVSVYCVATQGVHFASTNFSKTLRLELI